MNRLALAVIPALALAAGSARADVGAQVVTKPAVQAFPFLRDYYHLAPGERSRFQLAYRLQEKGKTSPARLTLLERGAETPLPTSPDGWITRLPGATALEQGAQVRMDAPADAHPGMTMIPEVVLHGGGEIEAADLHAASAQVAAVTRKMTGPLAFVAPKFTRVLFSGAQGASAVDAAGRTTPLPLWRGTPVLDLNSAQSVKSVRFERPPYHALLAPPAK